MKSKKLASTYLRTKLTEFLNPGIGLDSPTDKILFYMSLSVAIFSTYILSIQGINWIMTLKKIIFLLMPLILGTRSILQRRLNIWHFFFAIFIGIHFYFSRRLDVIAEFILLSWMVFIISFKSPGRMSSRTVWYIGMVLCLVVLIHFFFFEMHGGRESIGGLDPNYSSFLIFLLLPFSIYSGSKIILISIIGLGVMTSSRAFLLAMIIYFIVSYTMRFYRLTNFSFKKFTLLLAVLFLLMMGYSFYGYHLGLESYGSVKHGFARLFHVFNNPSDYQRWKANVDYFYVCFRNLQFFLLGSNPLTYLNEVSPFLPHNLTLLELASHGVFVGMFFILTFFGLIRIVFTIKLLPFFLGMSVYWFFLGIEIGAVYNVYLINLLLLFNSKEEKVSLV